MPAEPREANLAEHLRTKLELTGAGNGKIVLGIDTLDPIRDLKAPRGTIAVNIKVVAAATPFDRHHYHTVLATEQYQFPYSKQELPPKKMLLDTGGKAGDIAIVVVSVEYATRPLPHQEYAEELRNLPMAIVAMGRLGA